jgi:hypothetical protein
MQKIISLLAAAILTGCASTPFTFDGDNASKGFVVFSTGLSKQCSDVFNNTTLIIRDAKTDEVATQFIIKNMLSSPEFEEDETQVNAFPLESGDYIIRDFMSPNPLLFAIRDYYNLKPITMQVVAGQIQYKGSFMFNPVNRVCEKTKVAISQKNMKTRDMKKAAELQPQLFN